MTTSDQPRRTRPSDRPSTHPSTRYGVKCRTCSAASDQPCRSLKTNKITDTHRARIDDAASHMVLKETLSAKVAARQDRA